MRRAARRGSAEPDNFRTGVNVNGVINASDRPCEIQGGKHLVDCAWTVSNDAADRNAGLWPAPRLKKVGHSIA